MVISRLAESMTADRPRSSSPGTRPRSEFANLAEIIHEMGLMRRRRASYGLRLGVLLAICAVTAAGMLLLGDSWWQVGPAVVLGIVFGQFGFLAHDTAHKQVFTSHRANEWGARILSTIGIGLSYGWWTHKHNKHHRSPNQEGRDPDIAPGGLAFTPRSVAERPRWLRPVTRRQGYLFFPMLLLEGLNLHWAGLQTLARRADVPHRRLEASLILMRFAVYVAVLLLVMSPETAVLFLGVQMAVFGVVLGAAFAPNHKGMPIVPREERLDFLHRQVLMSRNVRGGWLVDFAMGGLNYQIEHHLFPSMPRANLRRARPIVRAFCQEHGITYAETSLFGSYRIVVRYLNEVGLGARDPFSCPFVEAYRG
jgi:fatty acid desaturase